MQTLDELLRAERQVVPDPAAEARNWAAIEHRLTHGPPPPPAAEVAPSALGGATGLKLVAGLVVAAAVGGLLAVGGGAPEPAPRDREVAAVQPVREDRSVPPAPVEPVASAVPEEPAAAPEPIAPVEPVTPPVEKRPARAKKASKSEPTPVEPAPEPAPAADDFAAELQLLAEIRGALKRGDHAGALLKIDEHVKRFGAGGQLVQERMASQVDALCGLGRVDDARRVAAKLLEKWPDSTHAPRVRASCAGA